MSLFGRVGKGTPFDWLVVGLGNPGKEYARTPPQRRRADASRLLAERRGTALKARPRQRPGRRGRSARPTQRVVLAFPITFMNDSGQAVGALVRRYRIETPEQIIVVHDELDLDSRRAQGQGRWRAGRPQRAARITQHLKTAGLPAGAHRRRQAAAKERGADHVLSKVPKRRTRAARLRVAEAADAVEMIVADGVDAAMQQFNGKR